MRCVARVNGILRAATPSQMEDDVRRTSFDLLHSAWESLDALQEAFEDRLPEDATLDGWTLRLRRLGILPKGATLTMSNPEK